MKRLLYNILYIALAATASAQEAIDTAQFVAVYDYECRTQDAEGTPVTDRMQLAVQVGRTVTKSMPLSAYQRTDEITSADAAIEFQEAMLHMPTVWTGYPEGQTTVREFIFPHDYEGYEPTPEIVWTLTDDTLTVGGYYCQTAMATHRGVAWTVCYTEDIPTSAGPWKLCGLPGLILKAETNDGIHRFTLASLQRIASPIYSETNAITSKTTEEKLIKNRIKTFGNRLYPKNPYYYITVNLNRTADVTSTNEGMIINNVFVNDKTHVYQPLELK